MLHKKMLIVALSGCLFGCTAASGPVFNPETTVKNDNLFVYRDNSAIHAATPCDLYVDNSKSGEVRDGGYYSLHIPTGKHLLVMACTQSVGANGSTELAITVKPGEKYYVRFDLKNGMTGKDVAETALGVGLAAVTGVGFMKMSYTLTLTQVPSSQAMTEMKDLRQST